MSLGSWAQPHSSGGWEGGAWAAVQQVALGKKAGLPSQLSGKGACHSQVPAESACPAPTKG